MGSTESKILLDQIPDLSEEQLQGLLNFARELFRITDPLDSPNCSHLFKKEREEWKNIQREILSELEKRLLLS